MAIRKWKGKTETTVKLGKTHVKYSIWTKYTHSYTMHAKTILEIIHATCYLQVFSLKLLHPTFLCLVLAFFTFLVLPLLTCLLSPLGALLLCDINSKTKLKKGCELILKSLFIIYVSNFFIFPLFSFNSLLTCNLWLFTFLFFYFPLFS